MIEVVPAVNVETFAALEGKIGLIEDHARTIHIDVADGSWTPNVLWHESRDLPNLVSKAKLIFHLMLAEVDEKISPWLCPPVARLIIHPSAARDPKGLVRRVKEAGKEVTFALEPGAPWTELAHYKGMVDSFLFLTVSPGPAGQTFLPQSLEGLKAMRRLCHSCILEVDGGMNAETIPRAVAAGANVIVAASAVFEASHPVTALRQLEFVANHGPSA